MALRTRSPILALAAAMLLAGAAATAGDDLLLDAREAHILSAARTITIVDVRTPAECRAQGIPGGAAAVSLNGAGGRQAFLDGILELVGGDRNRPLAMICNTGVRSTAAQQFLQRNGFTQIYNIGEGLHGSGAGSGWLADGLPVEPCERC